MCKTKPANVIVFLLTQVTSTAAGRLQATTVSTARGAGGASGGVSVGVVGGRGGGAAGNGTEPPVVR